MGFFFSLKLKWLENSSIKKQISLGFLLFEFLHLRGRPNNNWWKRGLFFLLRDTFIRYNGINPFWDKHNRKSSEREVLDSLLRTQLQDLNKPILRQTQQKKQWIWSFRFTASLLRTQLQDLNKPFLSSLINDHAVLRTKKFKNITSFFKRLLYK